MIGATVVTLTAMGPAVALIPLAVCILAAFVAYGRWRMAPHWDRAGGSPARYPEPLGGTTCAS